MTILDGKATSEKIKLEITEEVNKMKANNEKVPHLAAIIVGNDGASLTYVNSKVKSCERVGFESTMVRMPSTTSETELLKKIKELNENSDIDGFIVQLPLPKQIDTQKVLMAVDPDKDVDGFHPTNFGRMALDMTTFIPATPFGILELLERYEVETSGKHTVVIGRSHIVGRPMSILMGRKGFPGNSTVTLTHSRTKNITQITSQADIIITALGVPGFLKAEMVKDDAVVIDVGITRVPDETKKRGYYLTGDVDFENVSKKASFITPVPGGVGPMTIAMLLKNTLLARERHRGLV
ncbi:bifunctional 5,10-methylenetetrahydrofolate dehydrogenase/5,10-methenyltetrahydrofolate cyclohydrolase [Croceibacter atlanticus]|jgi:methylenetetrahydrofolate dehydrogenase (NADP+)/methenyltetrahydrofolate cyclohydrolase|uniref:Bifunctional protein FolD n=1 Tax=Croceibacter atlanticus (strain ATCC BAA-628 / JCM 21780 / CIP 108009 / IAM 15332 / KCTC 12090 / HTCC2559) TaxID=216432 RepID=A3U7Q6_CROAH|nr:tetrahydrofolate dehydrogenase/cyclohydrolase catalytic domain-containing protein [Croceibacter atlanticus]EAP88273.1 putative methenyltetrahydrofolate cyclohydrolase [Croceibacter atlanticus HTCC2559]MBW4969589.1 bifunctional 5,10-methylene-tetrahydrofolate dehydrogenase/5,10-methylene-tetrahydrofolate cyclohydrolase [Croceibacter atlanticus]HAT71107.1 bifunctional 5,10-methylene-tetrahydrofolate dehydrogenase/5,10-methylene-tetrahydrofolate cyclohydrolase [Flavobacteriaceae bacterium]|tara:strand:+ start:3569 stop:4453 length:885 start_codon:yes stop_codon:yes gene_type:complete